VRPKKHDCVGGWITCQICYQYYRGRDYKRAEEFLRWLKLDMSFAKKENE